MCGVFFLLHFYCSLFLMNGNLTFSLVEQDSVCFVALQTSFTPSPCLFFFFHPCCKQIENPKRKTDETRTKQTNFLETEVLVGKILTLETALSELDHNLSCWVSTRTGVLYHRAACRMWGPWCLLRVGKWWHCGFVFRRSLKERSHSLKNKLSENLVAAPSPSGTHPGLSQWRPVVM